MARTVFHVEHISILANGRLAIMEIQSSSSAIHKQIGSEAVVNQAVVLGHRKSNQWS
jgi:hypothetical protein